MTGQIADVYEYNGNRYNIVAIKGTMNFDIHELGFEPEMCIRDRDCTRRLRPGNRTLDDFFAQVRDRYPEQLFMADCSDYEEGMHAAEIGLDLIGTTMHGYTDYTRGAVLPALDLMKRLVQECGRPVIAEGGIWTPAQLKDALDTGVWAAVVGTAITRPREITRHFLTALDRA